jgi:hypothetical protein
MHIRALHVCLPFYSPFGQEGDSTHAFVYCTFASPFASLWSRGGQHACICVLHVCLSFCFPLVKRGTAHMHLCIACLPPLLLPFGQEGDSTHAFVYCTFASPFAPVWSRGGKHTCICVLHVCLPFCSPLVD